jgi:cell division protein FtsQ
VLLRYKLCLALLVLLAGYGAWLGIVRKLALFQVEQVTISGLSGDSAPQIHSTLELTAREMTTTDFSLARLRQAVAGYRSVAALTVTTSFPHGAQIRVVQREPLARIDDGGRELAVAGNDEVLSGLVPSRELPLVKTSVPPVGDRVTDALAREEIGLLAAAPAPLARRVYCVRDGREGLTVRLRGGPLIYFGGGELPHAKWDAAAAVLANPSARGARYVDVSLPDRPAAAIGDPATSPGGTGENASTSVATIVGASQSAASSSTSG